MPSELKHNLRALQAFEAVARLQSISRAADELGVTQSAVSHQVRRLTNQIGERLMAKSGRGVALSAAGEKLARNLRFAFSQIDRSIAEVIGSNREVVRLALCSSFAPGWLIPRLANFYASNPEVDLQLRMYARDPELTDEVADAFITTLPEESGFWSLFLRAEILLPVIKREPVSESAPRLITTDMEPGRIGNDWKEYCAISGFEFNLPDEQGWLFASHYVVAMDMVKAGLGAALVPDFLAESDLHSGKLELLNSAIMPTNQDYYLCIKEVRRSEQALDALSRWFKAELPREDISVAI